MEGNNVCKIYIMATFAADLLAGGYPCVASFSDSLDLDASVEADRHNSGSIFPVHQSLIHAPIQSPRRLKTIGDVPLGTTLFHIFHNNVSSLIYYFHDSG
jgi:hypothetical protein